MASAEFEAIFRVGTGNPSGVPRPVVKSSTVAPAATSAVDDTASLPGASSSASPGRVRALAVAQHLAHGRVAAFLHGAERFLLERRDAAGDVAGRGVLVDGLAVVEEVALEVVHERDDVVEHALVGGALHQQMLGAEHFGDLREDRRAAGFGHAICDVTHERIRGDAGEAVGAAALQADRERGERAGLAPVLLRDRAPALRAPRALLRSSSSVACALNARMRAGSMSSDFGEQRVELIRFAAETDDEHAAGVGMHGERGEHAPRVRQIVSELRAAEGMRERVHAIHAAVERSVPMLRDALRGARDAADRAQNPDFVARADAAIAPAIAHEGVRRAARRAAEARRARRAGTRTR